MAGGHKNTDSRANPEGFPAYFFGVTVMKEA
jgi:hypothetical protein